MLSPDDSHIAPWNQNSLQAAYFCQSLKAYIPEGGGDIWQRFSAGFLYFPSRPQPDNERIRFSAAVLHKIATRGSPTFCDPRLEEIVLTAANDAGLLRYRSFLEGNEFKIEPSAQEFRASVQACLFPELLTSDEELTGLIGLYHELCTRPERSLLNKLLAALKEKRLALMLVPQREFESMGVNDRVNERVDFAFEVPPINGHPGLKLVLEVDGQEHLGEKRYFDAKRDSQLKAEGWQIFRFDVRQKEEWTNNVSKVAQMMESSVPGDFIRAAEILRASTSKARQALTNLIFLPQAEGRLLQAISSIIYETGEREITVSDEQNIGLPLVVDGLNVLLNDLWQVHGTNPPKVRLVSDGADIRYFSKPCIQMWEAIFAGNGVIGPTSTPSVFIPSLLKASPRSIDVDDKLDPMRRLLSYILRKPDFRSHQMDIISRTLRREKVIGLLPTGAGKSLCYQLSSMLQPGVTLVVDPLRSLMLDQEQNLRNMGITRSLAIMKGGEQPINMSDRDYMKCMYAQLRDGEVFFAFISPERLQMRDFDREVRGHGGFCISHFVIDEAHCVSEWGHDFRPAYLNVGRRASAFEEDGNSPTVMALTGTASKNVLVDIKRELDVTTDDAVIQPRSFDRTELEFEVRCVSVKNRDKAIQEMTTQAMKDLGWNGEADSAPSGIVFTNFATPKDVGVLGVRDLLEDVTGVPMEVFSGTSPSKKISEKEWTHEKREAQERFKRDETKVMVCTHSFGMGIDKPNVRFTFNIMLPRSLEEFYQQAGRAGRDRNRSKCMILFTDDQSELADQVLATEDLDFPSFVKKVKEQGGKPWNQGDAVRNTYFLTNTFLGEEEEMRAVRHFVSEVLPGRTLEDENNIDWSFYDNVPFGELGKERVLYRLLLVGGIDDYFKDYSAKVFVARFHWKPPREYYEKLFFYLDKFLTRGEMDVWRSRPRKEDAKSAMIDCAEILTKFIYERIVKRRRRAIGQMLQVARVGCTSKQEFRRQLLAYLQESEFTPLLAEVATTDNIDVWLAVLLKVKDQTDLEKVIGACRRELEDNPSHPGLLLLVGLNAMLLGDGGEGDLRSAFLSMSRVNVNWNYDKLARGILEEVRRIDRSRCAAVSTVMLEASNIVEVARVTYMQGDVEDLSLRIIMNNLIAELELSGD